MKTYETKEQCLEANKEHAWYPMPKNNDGFSISCAVYHSDGYCSWNDPKEKCYHCPATRTYTRKQPAIYEWVEE